MSRITITGPFFQTTAAEITPEMAQKLLDGSYDPFECRRDIEDSNTWISIYGAEEPSLLLDDEELMDSNELSDLAAEQEQEEEPYDFSYPKESYPLKSVFLDKQPTDKYYFICREIWEGDEYLDFSGEFDVKKLKVSRISLWADDEICDVFNIEYPDSEPVDATIGESEGFWIYHDGVLTSLDDIPSSPTTDITPAEAKDDKTQPLYRDEFGNEWSGEGRKPFWVMRILETGEDLEQFRVRD